MQCDMCGTGTDNPKKGDVEGIVMNLCSSCMRYAKPVKEKPKKVINNNLVKKKTPKLLEMESSEHIVDDFAERITKKRRELQMPQKAFAVKLAEKESVIHSIETGKHEPDLSLAKKIERLLGIKLIEKETKDSSEKLDEYVKKNSKQSKSDKMTLGDMITIRKRGSK